MGFLNGSITFERYRIDEDPTEAFGESHIKSLKKYRIGAFETNLFEQPNVGFTGGAHLLDTDFSIEKNIIGEAIHFGIRIDSCSVPSSIKNAWMQQELAPMLVDNPGGKPSKAQKQEAKEAVEARCADEADKGNFKRMAETSVLWDGVNETIFLGGTSEKTNEMCCDLLERAFGIQLSRVNTSKLALEYAEAADLVAELYDVQATPFHPGEGNEIIWWNGMNDNYCYLGNEFLLWLWWTWETQAGQIELSDGSELAGMFTRSLSLDCPRGEQGKESISSESPVGLPEASLAIRMGKLPRKAGLTLARDGEQFDLTLQAENFTVNGARITQIDGETDIHDREDRIESIRQLCQTTDLLFEAFCEVRIGDAWKNESKKMMKWLSNESAWQKKKVA